MHNNNNEYKNALINYFISNELLRDSDIKYYDTDHNGGQIFLMLTAYRSYRISNEASEAIEKALESHTNFQINVLTNSFDYPSQCDYYAILDDSYCQENSKISHCFTIKVPDKVSKKVFNNFIEWAKTYRKFDTINDPPDALLELDAKCKEQTSKSINHSFNKSENVQNDFQFFKKLNNGEVISATNSNQVPAAPKHP